MLQILKQSPAEDVALGERLAQVGAELAQYLANLKLGGMNSADEERVSEIRLRREAAVKVLADARIKANAANPGRWALTREELALTEQIKEIDVELDRARQTMLESRDAFSSRYPKLINQQLRPSAPILRQAADAMEALQALLKQVDVFAWRNGIKIPRYGDALLSAADLRRFADRVGG